MEVAQQMSSGHGCVPQKITQEGLKGHRTLLRVN